MESICKILWLPLFFLNFLISSKDPTQSEVRSLPSLVILTITGVLPKCLGQAEPVPVHKHVMFHAFPEKTWGDKLHLDPPGRHHLENSLAMLWCCLRDAGRKELHLLLNFGPSFSTSLCALRRSRFWILKHMVLHSNHTTSKKL